MADLLDVLSLSEARTAINVTTSDHDTEIAGFVTSVSRRFDQLIGPSVNRTVTEEHDGGGYFIRPRKTPVSSITTLKEYDGSTTTTLTAESFGTEPDDGYLLASTGFSHSHVIYRRNSGTDGRFPAGRRNIELVYVAGRAANTAAVDARIKHVAGEVLRRLWKRESGVWSQSSSFFDNTEPGLTTGFFKAVDPMVQELLADELRLPGIA